MAGNRVEELEAKVRELEATIDGLTDELVETKERLHALGREPEPDILEGRLSKSAGPEERTAEPEPDPEPTDETGPADDGEASADGVNTDEDEGEDNAGSGSGDDIIVA
jgi:uncharacterized coiled-coil protein SlyX